MPPPTDFGWENNNGHLSPIMMKKPAQPVKKRSAFCNCMKGKCLKNCPCAGAKVPCIIACKCTGVPNKCARMLQTAELENSEGEN